LYNLLRFKGVELYSVCEGISFESQNAKTFFQIKGMVNELANELNALRTKRGQEARVLKGYSSARIEG
jgi:DNA invertase Pin-like site-specific DNA recombinase